MLDAVATRYGWREAMVFGEVRVSFAEFRERVNRLARGLAALGIRHGENVAIWLPNRPEWFFAQYACARLGAVVIALNPRYKAHELSYILGQSEAKALLMTDHLGGIDYFETLHEVLPELPASVPGELTSVGFPELRHVIVDADDPYPGCHRLADVVDLGAGSGASGGASVVPSEGRPPQPPAPTPRPDDVFTILYTSGTTSFPKGAMITHRNCVPHGWTIGDVLRMTPHDRVLHALPAAGTWGGVNIPLTTWSHGASLVLMDVFDPLRALQLIERERCTVWNAVDVMVKAVLDHPDLDRYDRSSLRTGGLGSTGGGGRGLFEAWVGKIGVRHGYEPYGMTEVNAMALYHDLDEPLALRKLPGVHPAPGLEVRVVHPETGAVCTPGEEGDLQVRGERVTRGYYKKPEETAAAFTPDGWFCSGDLGIQDGHGHTIFKGRLRETLRISHFMVAPGEIEAFLMSHPDVRHGWRRRAGVGGRGLPRRRSRHSRRAQRPARRPTEDDPPRARADRPPLRGEPLATQGTPAADRSWQRARGDAARRPDDARSFSRAAGHSPDGGAPGSGARPCRRRDRGHPRRAAAGVLGGPRLARARTRRAMPSARHQGHGHGRDRGGRPHRGGGRCGHDRRSGQRGRRSPLAGRQARVARGDERGYHRPAPSGRRRGAGARRGGGRHCRWPGLGRDARPGGERRAAGHALRGDARVDGARAVQEARARERERRDHHDGRPHRPLGTRARQHLHPGLHDVRGPGSTPARPAGRRQRRLRRCAQARQRRILPDDGRPERRPDPRPSRRARGGRERHPRGARRPRRAPAKGAPDLAARHARRVAPRARRAMLDASPGVEYSRGAPRGRRRP